MQKAFFLIFVALYSFACSLSIDKDEFTEQKIAVIYCKSKNVIPYIRPYRAALYYRVTFPGDKSRMPKKEIYFTTDEYVGNIGSIEYRFDKDKDIEIMSVSPSTDNKALFFVFGSYGDSDEYKKKQIEEFINKLKRNNILYIKYTPFNESPKVAKISLKGFTAKSKVIDRMIKEREKEIEKIRAEKIKKYNEARKSALEKIKNKYGKTSFTREECKALGMTVGWNFDLDVPVCRDKDGNEYDIDDSNKH